MPVLIDPAVACPLDQLLNQVQVDGLPWHLEGQARPLVAGLGSLQSAGPLEITFFTSPRYGEALHRTQAAAVIVTPAVAERIAAAPEDCPFVRVVTPDPYLLYARIAQWFDAKRRGEITAQVHPTAQIALDVQMGVGVSVGPYAVIAAGTVIGAGTRIGAGCNIGANCQLGSQVVLHPDVTLYHEVSVGDRSIVHSGAVLGADGFGFAPDTVAAKRGQPGQWVKIPQLGGVRIGCDVEIGANTTIDRGALDDTIIEDGVKLDDQIMVAHNVRIGAHTAIAACVGIAGSTRIGARCMIGGAAMIGGHLSICDQVVISGATAVISSITKPGRYSGLYPLTSHADWQRNAALVPQLAQLRRRLMAVERAVAVNEVGVAGDTAVGGDLADRHTAAEKDSASASDAKD